MTKSPPDSSSPKLTIIRIAIKWRKLRHNLEAARRQGHDTLITFGGAYSNHIRATAAAGHYFGFATIGMIRGEEHLPLNPSLACAVRHGMRLAYLDRATYREKMRPEVTEMLGRQFGRCYLLPEGGSNALAVRGCAEIPGEIGQQFDVICCACGTGGTLAGIAAGLTGGQRALGFSARTMEEFDQRGLLPQFGDLGVIPIGHFGGMPLDYTIVPGGDASQASDVEVG